MPVRTPVYGRLQRTVRTAEQRGIRRCIVRCGVWVPSDTAGSAAEGGEPCKFCLMCQRWLSIAAGLKYWYPDKAKTDGLGSYCKACMLARVAGRSVCEVVR